MNSLSTKFLSLRAASRAFGLVAFISIPLLQSCEVDTNAPAEKATETQTTVVSAKSAIGTRVSGRCTPGLPSCSTCGPTSCGTPCCAIEREPGFEFRYDDDCTAWANASWQPKAGVPRQICHLDIDTHFSGVDVEINSATAYQDVGCTHQPDRWKKEHIATVECSLWTSLTNKKRCEERIQNRVMTLAEQGYVPTATMPNKDFCPQPRL